MSVPPTRRTGQFKLTPLLALMALQLALPAVAQVHEHRVLVKDLRVTSPTLAPSGSPAPAPATSGSTSPSPAPSPTPTPTPSPAPTPAGEPSGSGTSSPAPAPAPAAASTVSLSTSSLSFGNVPVGTVSEPQAAAVMNSGPDAVTLSPLTVNGPFQATTSCTNTLAAAASCSVEVRFAPTATGSATGNVRVSHSGVNTSPLTLSLSGTGEQAAPVVELSPQSLLFPATSVGSSNIQRVTLRNTGNAPLGLTSAPAASGTGFAVAGTTCGASLAPDASCIIDVSFTPTNNTTFEGNLNFALSNGPRGVPLEGTGTGAVTEFRNASNVVITSLSFPDTAIGSTSATQTFTVRNIGNAPMTFTSPGATIPAPFSRVSDTCANATLAVNGTCTVGVRFSPTAAQAYSVSATPNSNAFQVRSLTLAAKGTYTYATYDPNSVNANATLSADLLTLGSVSSSVGAALATFGKDVGAGKWYYEVEITGLGSSGARTGWQTGATPVLGYPGSATGSWGLQLSLTTAPQWYSGSQATPTTAVFPDAAQNGDVYGLLVTQLSNATQVTAVRWRNGVCSTGAVSKSLSASRVTPMVGVYSTNTKATLNTGKTAFKCAPPADFNPGWYN